MAIKSEYQQAICDANALPTLVGIIKRYSSKQDRWLSGPSAQTCRRAADAITNLAHENNSIKTRVRCEGGIPPLVWLLRTIDPKVQRAVAGTLRTLAFKNDDNKEDIVKEGALPLLIQMLHARDTSIHYEAVGVIGNLVHSSPSIKVRVLTEGALQPVINLLSSSCPDSQREAALLLGQFATADGDYKSKIVQRGAVGPLIEMLSSSDHQLQEMAAFALGRLAQHSDNQAGIMAMGALPKLLELLRSNQSNLQHNAAFALYGLSENEDNLLHFVREGSFQCIQAAELVPQASRDCVQKMTKRLQEKLGVERVFGQVMYLLQGGGDTRRTVATALGMLCTSEYPPPPDLQVAMMERGGVMALIEAITDPGLAEMMQKEAAVALYNVATACGAAEPIQTSSLTPEEPRQVKLSRDFINNKTGSDVKFIVEGKEYYAHKLALLASSEIFSSMFGSNGNFRESQKDVAIPIPNISYEVFHRMITCIYTGTVDIPDDLAQDLLEAADQYMLDNLKRLCEAAIAKQLTAEEVCAAFELAEKYNATELGKQCALFCLKNYEECADTFKEEENVPGKRNAAFAALMERMKGRLLEGLQEALTSRAAEKLHDEDAMQFG